MLSALSFYSIKKNHRIEIQAIKKINLKTDLNTPKKQT